MPAPTLTPTYATGARGKTMPMVSHPPGRGLDDDAIAGSIPDAGMDVVFLADFLSAVLTHERCGCHLYRSVAGRTLNPVLRLRYEDFGRETERHAEVLEQLISAMGGDPQYVSPAARATEGMDSRLVESTFALAGSLDVMTVEMAMLDAVLAAEALDHSNWMALSRLAADLPDGHLRDGLRGAVDEVLADEDEHLSWARDTRMQIVRLQAEHPRMTKAAASVEQMTERIRSWFS